MIERCCLDRLVRIGGKSYLLAPPTIRQAVEILHVLEQGESKSDYELLAQLVCDLNWKPSLALRRVEVLHALTDNPPHFYLNMDKALKWGFNFVEIKKEFESDAKTSTKNERINWSDWVESYRAVYGGTRWQVWNEVPFPFFLESMNTLNVDRAKMNIRQAVASQPSKESLKNWNKIIQGAEPEPDSKALIISDLTPEEVERSRKLAKDKYLMGK